VLDVELLQPGELTDRLEIDDRLGALEVQRPQLAELRERSDLERHPTSGTEPHPQRTQPRQRRDPVERSQPAHLDVELDQLLPPLEPT
jgi:hypothetical protein